MIYLGNNPVGAVNDLVGSFTKHVQVKVTPSSSTYIEVVNTLGVAPKLVVVTGVTEGQNKIKNFVASGEAVCAAYRYTSSTNGTGAYCAITSSYDTASTTDARVYLGADKIHIHEASGTRNFSIAEYTVDIYA